MLNDFVGASAYMTTDEWRAQTALASDQVTDLGIAWRRPLVENQDVDPDPEPPPGDFGAPGAGCDAGGGSGVLALLALAGVRRRRRLR
jgi:uncharacterized protein (TIGR03382 family)